VTAPVLAVGDGALGFWNAVREVFPATREQRCWFHKQANVLAALPKSAHPSALAALKEIYNAEDIDKAQVAVKAFEVDFGAKYPKAVAKITDDLDTLLEFYRYPAEHWIHLRTTNPIESTFATVRLRTKVTKGPGSRAAGLAMAYKLIDAAAARWRAVNAPHLGRPGARRRGLPQGQTARTPHRITPPTRPQTAISKPERRSPETPDPQVLTIPRSSTSAKIWASCARPPRRSLPRVASCRSRARTIGLPSMTCGIN
jgi:Transposase and inactivated derivatives